MKSISLVFVSALLVAAVGCNKKKGGGDNGDDCTKAITHSMELSKADMAKMPGMDETTMKDVGVRHCKDDKWSDDVLKCMSDAKSKTDAQACYGRLSPEQREKMNTAAREMMKTAGGAGGAGAAMGSDVGSAGSAGSAAMGGGSAGSAAAK